jgi:hypothetical protein
LIGLIGAIVGEVMCGVLIGGIIGAYVSKDPVYGYDELMFDC